MKISVITAVYNRAATIHGALESVARQRYRTVEHIVQDGGSTDGTLDILYNYSKAPLSIVSEPDQGLYDALNRAIRRCTGDIIGFVHSDDFLAHQHVLGDVAEVMENTAIDGVYGDLDYVSAKDPGQILRRWRSGPYDPQNLYWGWSPPHPTLYLRRTVYETYGLFDTSYRISGDYEATLRFLAKGDLRLAYLPDVMVKMRVGGTSNRSLQNVLRKSVEDLRAIRSSGVGGIGTLLAKNGRKIPQFFAQL